MKNAHRRQLDYGAFLLHRLSGLALAIFLPLHFLVLGLALEEGDVLEGALQWSAAWPVKIAEFGLVVFLALHLLGGLRLLAMEFLPPWDKLWAKQKALIVASFGAALTAGLAFLLSAGS